MLRYNRNRARGRFFPLFSPRELFYGGIPGAWYDPTDLSTMFQDSAGTTPVTAVEQPVGLILDKSQGLALGPELVTNGSFSVDANWTKGTGWTISGGSANYNATGNNALSQAGVFASGKTYLITFTMTVTSGGINLWINGTQLVQASITTSGTKTFRVTTTTAGSLFFEATAAAGVFSIDNVSVVEIAGNHAYQSTAASRPTFRARYNLLTYSEEFDNAAWFKTSAGTGSAPVVTPNADIAPDGTLTADSIVFNRGAGNAVGDQSVLSQGPTVTSATYTQTIWLKAATLADVGKQLGLRNVGGTAYLAVTLTSDWVRYTRVETGPFPNFEIANRGTITTGNSVTALVWGAQLLTAADVTATGNAYQRIAAATVYDTAPIFRPYLAFDGVDDSLATAAINLTSTDKMTVFAGVTKSTDAGGTGMVVELSASVSANNGSFYISAPNNVADNFGFASRGTATQQIIPAGYAAPMTSVLTAPTDIAAPLMALRRNGIQIGSNANSQGTGTFGNYAMFIGRRNNSLYPLNGRLYSLIVRGAASSTTEIIDTETWVNQRTGGY